MNDLEHDLRTLLQDKAAGGGTPKPRPPLLRRARLRQLGTVLGGVVLAAAIVGGAIVAITELAPSGQHTPGDSSAPLVETTVNGITITHPESWYVVDPVAAGIEPSDNDLPHLVLFVSDTDPMASGTLGCPALGDGATGGLLLTLQQEPLALTGEAARGWPVELVPMDVGTSGSTCYPDWTFRRASWTSGGRTFEARVGVGPDASDGDRTAVDVAFASLRIAPTEAGSGSVVLATGTAGGEDWELIATHQNDGLSLTLQGESFGTGTGGFDPGSNELRLTSQAFGDPPAAERVLFAAVPTGVVLIAGMDATFGAVYPEVLDVPDEIDDRLDAFVTVVDADQAIAFVTYDARDRLVASGGIDAEGNPLPHPSPPDEVLFNGRLNDCWWSLTRTTESPTVERIQLVSSLGDPLVELSADVGSDAPALQLDSFDCPRDGTDGLLVFGIVRDTVADIGWNDPYGSAGLPDCLPAELPSGFCSFLLDLNGPGEAVALDANGREVARAPY